MQQQYNGYRFSFLISSGGVEEKERVYNPFSINNLIAYKTFDDYWVESGGSGVVV